MHPHLILATLALAGLSSSHFILQWPETAGFDDDLEATAPCGSFTPKVDTASPEIQVGRFAISIQNVHPIGQWSFRGTTDTKAPFAFEEIVPLVNTTGVGDFCLDYMHVPRSWAGKPGILQVVDNSPDGILYQCAPVNFVQGTNSTVGASCRNATGFKALWTQYEGFEGEKPSPASTASIATSLLASVTASASASTGAAATVATDAASLFGGLSLLIGVLL